MTPAQKELMALPVDIKPAEDLINAAFPIVIDGPKAVHRNDSGAILVGFLNGRLTTTWFNVDGNSGFSKSPDAQKPTRKDHPAINFIRNYWGRIVFFVALGYYIIPLCQW